MNVNTKPVPIIIVLIAAAVSCVMSILQHAPFGVFFTRLLITVLVFAVVGTVTKIILDKVFGNGKKEEVEEEEKPEGFVDTEDTEDEQLHEDMENVELESEPDLTGEEFIGEMQDYLDEPGEESGLFDDADQEQEEAS